MKNLRTFEEFVNENHSKEINEAAHVPSNILDFAKRKGRYATSLVRKAANWAEKAGRYISGGTAIGKNYDTIILDMKHHGSEIYISLNKETIELFGEEVKDAKSFAKVLAANENEQIKEKMDTKYWADYNLDGSGQSTENWSEKSKNFEWTFDDAVDEWNAEAERESQIKGKQISHIKKLAQEFFKIEKWISINVIHAMIAQESKNENITESVISPKEIQLDEFPNPITKTLADIFIKKGKLDGEKRDDIVRTVKVKISADQLKPSQDAIYLGKVLGMAIAGIEGGELGAIISKDNYILDGHHRWASTMFNNSKAKIIGYKSELGIGDLIPVLRALGDVFGNDRRGEPKGGDVNIFEASIEDAMNCIMNGTGIDSKFYNKEKSIDWLNKIGGKIELQKALARIQSVPPPIAAPPRKEMPVIDAEKGEEKKAADLLNKGSIDVRSPYKK